MGDLSPHVHGFGVLGGADIAWRRTVPAISRAGGRVLAVASRTRQNAQRFADRFGCAAVQGYRELLARQDIEAVYIPLPNALHEEWVEAALLAGKHVLVEKSLTARGGSARRLVTIASSLGLLLMENFAFLHHRQHQTVRDLIARGEIGEPRHVFADFGIPPGDPSAIRYRPELGGGSLLEVGTYCVRTALLYLGQDARVAGAVLHRGESGVDICGGAVLGNPAGMTAHCAFGMLHGYRSAYTIWGSEGRLTLDRAFTPERPTRPTLRLERQEHREERILAADDQFGNMIRCFIEAMTRPERHALHAADIVSQAGLLEQVRSAAQVVEAVA